MRTFSSRFSSPSMMWLTMDFRLVGAYEECRRFLLAAWSTDSDPEARLSGASSRDANSSGEVQAMFVVYLSKVAAKSRPPRNGCLGGV